MATTIIISENDSSSAQQEICQSYISTHTLGCEINGQQLSFLPTSAVNALATEANIKALVAQDPGLQQTYFSEHSQATMSARMYSESRKISVAAVSEGLGMNVLRVLRRGGKVADEHLPLPDNTRPFDSDNKFWPLADVRNFLEAQPLVSPPVFTLGEYDRKVAFFSSLRIVEATLSTEEGTYPSMYEVRFHYEHLRMESYLEPGGGTEGRLFVMTVFATIEEAELDQRWVKRVFGFVCAGRYYLVGDP